MHAVYIDILFMLNFFIDYIILLSVCMFCGIPPRRKRMLVSSLVGATYAIFMFFPHIPFAYSAIFRLIIGMLMVFVAFSVHNKESFARLIVLFYVISFCFAGAVNCAYSLFGGMFSRNGVYYMNVNMVMLVSSIVVCYGFVSFMFKKYGKTAVFPDKTNELYISMNNKNIKVKAFVDTGHNLTDITTGLPVIIIEKSVISQILPKELLFIPMALNNKAAHEVFEDICSTKWGCNFRLISYSALGIERGMLLAFKPDMILKDGQKYDAVIAISPNKISNGAYCALVSV